MKSKTVPLFLIGLLTALGFQWSQAQAFQGEASGLLGVGENSDLRPLIEGDLGPVPLWPGSGHDGQISYAIARDPSGLIVAPLLDHGGYRYRRILYPTLAGGGGLLSPPWTLWGLILWSAIGIGLSAVAGGILAERFALRPWVVAIIILSPGAWLSARLLTSDALGFGLALLGLAIWTTGRRNPASILFALAPLAKDQFLLVGIVVALAEAFGGRIRQAARVALATVAPLFLWALTLELSIGGGLSPRSNFDLPFAGILESATTIWPLASGKDSFYTIVAGAGVIVGLVGGWVTTSRLFRLLSWSWVGVAVIASSWIWDLGNNSVRVLAPALVFGAIAIGERQARVTGERAANLSQQFS